MSIFEKINKQSGIDFLINNDVLDIAKLVSIDVRNEELAVVLDRVFEGQPLSYELKDKAVIVKKKTPSFLDKISVILNSLQDLNVGGKVLDEQGQPLIGATVKVKGSTLGTMTDKEGEFFLKSVPEDAVIVIAYLGYKPLELKASASMGVIKMELATSELNEVVVNKGYYTETQRLSTGSVVKISAKDIERQPVTSPMMALQGRLSGVEVTPNSGVPGSAAKVVIRGRNSISNINSTPLYIIDGVQVNSSPIITNNAAVVPEGFDPLSTLNSANIESIEVLRDADATAIYGSRGANGVILITTKQGGRSEKTNIDINLYSGVG
ncbi:MAG: SusC/RagA family TonB-linked outer membrane protein, partial [Sphingobacteriales bacterium]